MSDSSMTKPTTTISHDYLLIIDSILRARIDESVVIHCDSPMAVILSPDPSLVLRPTTSVRL